MNKRPRKSVQGEGEKAGIPVEKRYNEKEREEENGERDSEDGEEKFHY